MKFKLLSFVLQHKSSRRNHLHPVPIIQTTQPITILSSTRKNLSGTSITALASAHRAFQAMSCFALAHQLLIAHRHPRPNSHPQRRNSTLCVIRPDKNLPDIPHRSRYSCKYLKQAQDITPPGWWSTAPIQYNLE